MASLQLTGTIAQIFEAVQITDKFRKREFLLQTDEKYPQTILTQLINDRIPLMDKFSEGQQVLVSFNLKGFKMTKGIDEKYYVNVDCWKIEAVN